jgi:hypothetical protein
MSEWWSYRPSDFLMFSPRVYERLIESHNVALWPLQLVALSVVVGVLALAWAKRPADGRYALGGFGLGLAFVAWSFLWGRYADINWAAGYAAPAFMAEALGLVALAALSREPLSPLNKTLPSMLAAALILLAAFAYPLAAPLTGQSWRAAQVAGVMPDPTALATLGLVLFVRSRAAAIALTPVPLLWSVYAAVTQFTLGAAEAWAMSAGVALFLAAAAARALSRQPAAGASA